MVAALSRLTARVASLTFVRYVGASGVALGADFALFLALLAAGLWAPGASALSYGMGIGVHWLISSRLVFADHAATGGARTRQKGLFLASALVGLALTFTIVAVGEAAGLDPRAAKLAAVAVSFLATYILRKTIVFAP